MDNKINNVVSIKLFDQSPLNLYQLEPTLTLEPLSKVNLFVGQNNSGKSRFLRGVFISKELYFRFRLLDNLVIKDIIKRCIQALKSNVFIDGVVGLSGIRLETFVGFEQSIEEHFYLGKDYFSEFKKLLERVRELPNGTIETKGSSPSNINYYFQNFRQNAVLFLAELEKTNFNQFVPRKLKRIYIPIIRGMRPLSNSNDNYYYDRTVNDYFKKSFEKNDPSEKGIFTGLELYNSIKSKILGEPEDRDDIEQFQKYLSKVFFNNKRITLIPRDQADTIFIKIEDEPQLPIYNLGDGIQNLIIILYNIILEKEDVLFFIEEPDLAMHPGLQRLLIEQMLSINKHQFFITTHSNHLLDLTLDYSDISVFHFSKEIENGNAKFIVNHKSNFDRILLQDLGVKNSSVFLANCSVWVEGITDRMYLRFI